MELYVRDQLDGIVPSVTRRVRVGRKSNKRIKKEMIVISRLVFADVDPQVALQTNGVQQDWRRNDDWIEVGQDEVNLFVETVRAERVRGGIEIGDMLRLSAGPFSGFTIRVTTVMTNKVRGWINDKGVDLYPIEVDVKNTVVES